MALCSADVRASSVSSQTRRSALVSKSAIDRTGKSSARHGVQACAAQNIRTLRRFLFARTVFLPSSRPCMPFIWTAVMTERPQAWLISENRKMPLSQELLLHISGLAVTTSSHHRLWAVSFDGQIWHLLSPIQKLHQAYRCAEILCHGLNVTVHQLKNCNTRLSCDMLKKLRHLAAEILSTWPHHKVLDWINCMIL
jgi:hypothetical protein